MHTPAPRHVLHLLVVGALLVACSDTVYQVVPPAAVTLQGVPAQIQAGQTAQLSAQVRSDDGQQLSGHTVTWSTSDDAVATVDGDGRLSALATGTVTIEARCEHASGSAETTVTPRPVASVEVEPAEATLWIGRQFQLAAILEAADGTVLADRPVTWTTSSSAVATVDAQGLATGTGLGTATITATAEGQSGAAEITVVKTVGSIEIHPPNGHQMPTDWTWGYAAAVQDVDGAPMPDQPVTWSSSDETVATVDEEGRVHTVSAGTVEIQASAQAVTTASTLVVAADPCAAVTLWGTDLDVTSKLEHSGCRYRSDGYPSEFFGLYSGEEYSVRAVLHETGFEPATSFWTSNADYEPVDYLAGLYGTGTEVKNAALLPAGHQLLEVHSHDGQAGSYALTVEFGAADPQVTDGQKWLIVPPRTYNGSLSSDDYLSGSRYYDYFYLMLDSGQTITINYSSSVFDNWMALVSGGEEVASDDDSGGNYDARITHTAANGGYFTIVLTSYDQMEQGPYRLDVTVSGGDSGQALLNAPPPDESPVPVPPERLLRIKK